MKHRLVVTLVAVACLAIISLPATAMPSQGGTAPAWFGALPDWLQTGLQQVIGLVSGTTASESPEDPPPLVPVESSGPDGSGDDPGTESSPEFDPNG